MSYDKISQIREFLRSMEGDYEYTSKERILPVFFAVLFCFICPGLAFYSAWTGTTYSGLNKNQDLLLALAFSAVSFFMGGFFYLRSRYKYVITSSHVYFYNLPDKFKWSIPIERITNIEFPPNSGKFSMHLLTGDKKHNIDLCDDLRIKILNYFDEKTNLPKSM